MIKQIDLNNESPAIRLPNKQEVTKMYSSIFSKNGEIYMSLQIPAVGFVAGQKMCIVIDVSNNSNITVDEIKLSLKKTVCYNATLPGKFTKEKMEPVEVKRLGGVGKHDKTTFDVPFEIPAIPPTNQGLCKVISIHYEIEVKAKVVNTFHNSAKISIPILIGTIPINPAIAWQHQSNLETTLGPFASTSTFISELRKSQDIYSFRYYNL